ncbi:MAG: NB-ARC domain-containing protein [Acidimicrobiia bacterium]
MGSVHVILGAATYTFLFTDIEGSTRLWEEFGFEMEPALALHDRILHDAVAANDGSVFKHTGDGIAAIFTSADGAAQAAVDAQDALVTAEWPATGPLRVRMGVHTGEATSREGDYYGTSLNRVARLMGVAHGGQMLISAGTASLLSGDHAWRLRSLGSHRLRDLSEPIEVLQIVSEGLESDFPPLRTLDAYPSNLPRNLPLYVGREDLVERLEDDIRTSPVITLAGLGGVGKTRLAQQLGAQVLPHFEHGVWFVDLAQLGTSDSVLAAVARTLAIRERATEDVLVTIAASLRDRQTLVILDNSEQVTPIVADMVERVIAAAEGVRFIITTREPLGVYGEKVVRLEGLETQPARDLFTERAAEAGFRVQPEKDGGVIDELTLHLDGLPLAIELAAARTRSMTPSEILDRVDERFRILKGTSRRVERHRTLEAMVDWSYGLLDADESLLLDRLSIFVGSFDLKSVEEVCGIEPLDPVDVVDLLDRLVDKSLVSASPTADTTRFRLLETVQQYARRRVSPEDSEDLLERHVRYFSGRALSLGARIERSDMAGASATIGFEADNLHAALARLTEQGRHDEKTQVVSALALYWTTHAPASGRQLFEELVEVADQLEPDLRMAMLISAASLNSDQGYASRALDLLETAKAVADQNGLDVSPFLYYVAANVAEMDGRTDDAIRFGETGLELAEDEDDFFMRLALRSRMLTSIAKTDPDRALKHAQDTLELAQEAGADLFVAAGHFLEGTVHFLSHRMVEADACFNLAIEVAGEALPQVVIGSKVESAAGHLTEDPENAKRLLREAIRLEATGDVMPAFRALAGDLMASIWIEEGRLTDAATVLAANRGLRQRLGFSGVWWGMQFTEDAWERVEARLETSEIEKATARGLAMADDDVRNLIGTRTE